MKFKYEIVKISSMYPAKLFLQDNPGRRCNTSLHWHSALEFLYIIDGALNVLDEGKETQLKSGDVYFVNHDRFHRTTSDAPEENVKYLVVLLSYEKLRTYYPNIEKLEFSLQKSPGAEREIAALLGEIAENYERRQTGYEMKINSLLHEVYYLLISACICEEDNPCSSISNKELEYVKTAIEYMGAHYLEELTLKSIAEAIGLSESYFSRCFKNITRTSVMQYLANLRLEAALTEILSENKSVTAAAFDNGFTSVKSLIEVCKKTYDCTPGQYKFKNK